MVRDEEHRMELIPNGFDIIEIARRLYHPFDRDQSLAFVHLKSPTVRTPPDPAKQSVLGQAAAGRDEYEPDGRHPFLA
jgi:hypothetical protein